MCLPYLIFLDLLLIIFFLALLYPRYEVYRGYIVFAFSVIMFVCLSVKTCVPTLPDIFRPVTYFFFWPYYTPGTKYIGGI